MRKRLRNLASVVYLTLAMVWCARTAELVAQDQPYSSSREYRAMLEELTRKTVRPSRMSAGELLKEDRPPVRVEVSETNQSLRFETALWRLEIRKNPWELALANKHTGAEWQMAPGRSRPASVAWFPREREKRSETHRRLSRIEQIEGHDNQWTMQGKVEGATQPVALELAFISLNVIRLSIDASNLGGDVGLELSFLGPGPFFGLGERFGKAKLDGLKTTLRPDDRLGEPGHNWTYVPVPFLFTPRGLGLYFDTAWTSTFDLTDAGGEKFSVRLEGPSSDCYFFVDREPKKILESYTALTGRSPLLPPWAFGVWINSIQGRERVLNVARRLRREGIPSSAIWVYDLMDTPTNTGWPLWTVGFYGSPRPFTDELHNLGFKAMTYFYPFVRSLLAPYLHPNPTYQEGLRNRFFVLKPDGQPVGPAFEPFPTANIDFLNPAAVDWWEKMIRGIVIEQNFDGWMEDFGEWVEDDHRFAAGKTGREMANLYPLFYHKITYQISRKLKPDWVTFVRSGSAGSQGYTRVVWGGDQFPNWTPDYGLPSLVPAGISAGLSGFAIWGPDILSSGTSKELWTRWTQFGALTPIMRDHPWDKPKFAVDLWFDSETTDTFRRYARLHVSLFPYFYTYAHEAAKTGLPIMRHLLLEWPDDPNTYAAEYEYLLGEKILVAPVVWEGARTRSLYLPKGSWVDFWTGQILEGGRRVEVPAPLERIPILVRAGSVIPFVDERIETLAQDLAAGKYRTLDNSLTWRVFPAAGPSQTSFTLYDGTRAIAEQESSQIQVKVERSPVIRQYEIVLPAATAPREVTVSGQRLDRLDDSGYRARKKGWWLDSAKGTLHALFLAGQFTLSVVGP